MTQKILEGMFEVIQKQGDIITAHSEVLDNYQNRLSEAEQRIAFLEAMMYEREHEFQFGESNPVTLQ